MSGRREWIISTLIENDTVTIVQRRHSSPQKPSASALHSTNRHWAIDIRGKKIRPKKRKI